MDKNLDVLLWRPAAASLLPHVGFASPPGVWYLPSGGWICHLKLTGCKPLKMAESLYCLCDSAKRQMVAETACGTASDCAHSSNSAWANTHTGPPGNAQWVWPSRMTALPRRASCERRPDVLALLEDGGKKKKNSLSSGYLFCSICRGVEQGGRLRKATDIRANLARKAQNQKILVPCWVYLLAF